ncbi:deaminase domain-containing protein [[Limnothrix rosea] IAM M-220]|uniref:deaminase domain-containing protein n=1 Tax=[Limnothrix rosea] IAM M-220 TaxID=454133 RepID=UPI000963061C|nr:hypothetical protein NIES208_08100 [[Limnothrix rosea] IAM M-220]
MSLKTVIDELKRRHNISGRRNITVAVCVIGSHTSVIYAVSGRNNSYGGLPLPQQQNRQFTLINPPPGHDRDADSEYKVLEYIASMYSNSHNISGTIRLHTERAPCLSCQDVIVQFKRRFPNIILKVSHSYS